MAHARDRPSIRRALGDNAQPEGTHRAWPTPASYDRARLAHGRALFVGDAANVVDPMTGEGIAQALETGALPSAPSPASPGDPDRVAGASDDVDRTLGADLRFAGLLQHILRVPLAPRAIAAGRAHSVDAAELRPLDVRGLPRALVLTPSRWAEGDVLGGGGPTPTLVEWP